MARFQDDVMIDIVVMQESDQIVMSIEYAGTVLDAESAQLLVEEWAASVKKALKEDK